MPKSIIDTSKQLFKRVDEEKLLKGKPQDAIIAACIFIACRQGRVPRTFKEIVALSKVPKNVSSLFSLLLFLSFHLSLLYLLTNLHLFPQKTKNKKQSIAVCFKAIEKAFDTAVPGDTSGASQVQTASADSLITRFCNFLGLSVPVQRAAVFVVTRANEEGILAGRSPITIAGACILFATTLWGVGKSAKEIAVVAGVQDSTIRVAYK